MAYMAPERFGTDEATAAVDVYALACVLCEALTGSTPFRTDSLEQVIGAHLSAPPPRPSSVNPRVPAAVDDVVARGMAKQPDDRYGSAGAFARAAGRAMNAGGASTAGSSPNSAETMARPYSPATYAAAAAPTYFARAVATACPQHGGANRKRGRPHGCHGSAAGSSWQPLDSADRDRSRRCLAAGRHWNRHRHPRRTGKPFRFDRGAKSELSATVGERRANSRAPDADHAGATGKRAAAAHCPWCGCARRCVRCWLDASIRQRFRQPVGPGVDGDFVRVRPQCTRLILERVRQRQPGTAHGHRARGGQLSDGAGRQLRRVSIRNAVRGLRFRQLHYVLGRQQRAGLPFLTITDSPLLTVRTAPRGVPKRGRATNRRLVSTR